MELEVLAKEIIRLEEKLAEPNEESFLIETQYPLKVKQLLEGIGYLSKYNAKKLFFQAYLPQNNSVSDIELRLYLNGFRSFKISHAQPSRARCFDSNEARKAFQDYYTKRFNLKEEDFIEAKKIAVDLEYKSGKIFPRSVLFVYQPEVVKKSKAR